MIILELIFTLYAAVVLGTTSIIEALTGLYPREQLAYVQHIHGLPETSGVADTISAGVLK